MTLLAARAEAGNPLGGNVSTARASTLMSTRPDNPPVPSVAGAARAVVAAGIAAAAVGGISAYLMWTWMGSLAFDGLEAVAAVIILFLPIVTILVLLVPFAAGVGGGLVGGRPVAAIGSFGGLLAGYGLASAAVGTVNLNLSSPEGAVALLASLAALTLVGHFTGLAVRRIRRR
jgi:hypothetical protein